MAQMKIQLQKHYLNTVQSQYAEVMNTIYSQLNLKDQVITTISKKEYFFLHDAHTSSQLPSMRFYLASDWLMHDTNPVKY